MSTVITPGGRVGNDARHGSRSNGENWVERSPAGELPEYIRIVRNGLIKQGHSESRATALAVGAVKRWASGRGNVRPQVRAAAAKAVAQWEAMKASAKTGEGDMQVKRAFSDEHVAQLGEKGHAFKNSNGDWSFPIENEKDLKNAVHAYGRAVPADRDDLKSFICKRARDLDAEGDLPDDWKSGSGEKFDEVELEHKAVAVNGVKQLISTDDTTGIVEAYVSVTGVRDNVGDIIEPGAYTKTLKERTPKGIDGHDWQKPTSKAIDIKELLPGDPNLPKTIKRPDGTVERWPADAGALYVKAQFNLNTQRGRDAYEDVKFYGDDQEWSIGYNVPAGKATIGTKGGMRTRSIKELDLYEYSHVLWGAMPLSRSKSVKDAQEAHLELKSAFGDAYYITESMEEIESFVAEHKSWSDYETKDFAAVLGDVNDMDVAGEYDFPDETSDPNETLYLNGTNAYGEDYEGDDEAIDLGVDDDEFDDDDEDDDYDIEPELNVDLDFADIKSLQRARELINQMLDPIEDDGSLYEFPSEETKTLASVFDNIDLDDVPESVVDTLGDLVVEFDEATEQGDAQRVGRVTRSLQNYLVSFKDNTDLYDKIKPISEELDDVINGVVPEKDEEVDVEESAPVKIPVGETANADVKTVLASELELKSLQAFFS